MIFRWEGDHQHMYLEYRACVHLQYTTLTLAYLGWQLRSVFQIASLVEVECRWVERLKK